MTEPSMNELPAETSEAPEEFNSAGAEETEAEFIAEPKKPLNRGTLVLFGIFLMGAVGMYFMYQRSGPRAADASTVEQTAAAQQTVNQFLSDGNKNLRLMEEMIRNTEKIVRPFRNYPSTKQVPLTGLQTNPFIHNTPRSETPSNDGDDNRLREADKATLMAQARALKLQSIVHSDSTRACMIDNAMYEEGQEVHEFTIEKIEPNRVIVKKNGCRFELRMQK